MALGKQIRRYRELLDWKLLQLSIASGVEVGTISALELRDSRRSDAFLPIAKAFGLTLEQLADETRMYTPDPPSQQVQANKVGDVIAVYPVKVRPLEQALHLVKQLNADKLPEVISYLTWQVASQTPHPDGHNLSVAAQK